MTSQKGHAALNGYTGVNGSIEHTHVNGTGPAVNGAVVLE